MSLQVVLTRPARRELRRLSSQDADRVLRALQRYGDTRQGDTVLLRGTESVWRLRVGDYRVFFTFNDDRTQVIVFSIRHRREAYRNR